ncbi:MAG: ribosomal protein S18-alanine N-acetyltransferase [Clostridia bacterium]|nr:ribosomal protein S18-alanine N-acetyltransferase [Clostridia bacterium]
MIEVRPLREGEALAASEIEKECLSTAWSEGQIRDRSPEMVYLLALVDGVPAGILSASLSLYDGELLNIAVLPDLRGRGVAQALLEELYTRMQGLPELFLEVAESNLPAQRLYEKNGFSVVGRRKGFYGGEDALVMRKQIC